MITSHKIQGLSLIEVLITVSIFVAVFSQTLPLAQRWYETLEITNITGQLKTAMAQAKSLSQLNKSGTSTEVPNTAVCLNERVLSVKTATATEMASCSNDDIPTVWSANIRVGFDIKVDSKNTSEPQDLTCICYRPSGFSTIAGPCNSCQRASEFLIYTESNKVERVSIL